MVSCLLSKSLSYSKGNLYIDTRSKWVIYIFCVDGLKRKVTFFTGMGVLNFAFCLDFLPFFCISYTHTHTCAHVHTYTHTRTHKIPTTKKQFYIKFFRRLKTHTNTPSQLTEVKDFQQIRAVHNYLIISNLNKR